MIDLTLKGVGDVAVEGEITSLNISSKGGVNIVIKDPKESAVLNISGYAPRVEGLNLINEGMQVVAFGVPSLWSAGGRFSLTIYKIIPMGAGALKEAYEKLKVLLRQEGLFEESRKRPLPEIVTRAALITGKDSAAQSDFLKIIRENKVGIELDLYNVQVQGKFAEQEILAALKYCDVLQYDCIFLVRGGGSLEDLITFNSERVARQIFAMKTPVVVGVGHEKDESIADFVADIRASTPSQAAYYLFMHNLEFLNAQELKCEQMGSSLRMQNTKALQYISQRYKGMASILRLRSEQIFRKAQELSSNLKEYKSKIKLISQRLESLIRILNSLNPQNVLKRGYAIVRNNGKILKDTNILKVNDELDIKLNKGSLISQILKIKNNG
jgi:exodeoxyribonuclease VII large subunit